MGVCILRCFIIGCDSTSKTLRIWNRSVCEQHNNFFHSNSQCNCPEPFQIFSFPRNTTLRWKWINAANRLDKVKLKRKKRRHLLRPTTYNVVCSKHFPGGIRLPDSTPTLNLGYNGPNAAGFIDDIFDINLAAVTMGTTSISDSDIVRQGDELPVATTPSYEFPSASTGTTTGAQSGSSPQLYHGVVEDSITTYPFQRKKPSSEFTKPHQHKAQCKRLKRNIEEQEESSQSRLEILYSKSGSSSGQLQPVQNTSTDDTDGNYSSSSSSQSSLQDIQNTPSQFRKHLHEGNELQAEVERLRHRCELWGLKHENLKRRMKKKECLFNPLKLIVNSRHAKLYTGFPNRETFDSFFEILLPRARRMRFWRRTTPSGYFRHVYQATPKRHGPPRQLPLKLEFLMTLMRLRLGIIVRFLAHLFGVSRDYCSSTLITWIKFLAIEWKSLVNVPTRQQVYDTLPKAFKSTPYVKHIIDGTDIFCEGSGDLKMRTLMWSNYKHHHTAKFLISITPAGHICFVSKAYGGHISNKELTQVSGFYDILEPYDEVIADKGFPIATELNERLCTLRMPKRKRGIDQLSEEDIRNTKKIANTRIHVDRVIRRIKTFRILQGEVPMTLLPQLSDIMIICCAICNTLPAPISSLYPKLN